MDALSVLPWKRGSVARFASRCCMLTAMLAFLFAGEALAQDDLAALQIKAAFVHKFADYVQGPGTAFDQADSALVYGVAGSDQVFGYLSQLVAGQNSGMRAAQVRRITSVPDLAGVNVLFIGEEARAEADELLQSGVAASILTVTDLAGPQPEGSMIHFFVADDRVRFDIALPPAQTAGLRLSSRLLQVARQVIGDVTATGN